MAITTTPSGGPQGEFSTYTPIYATTLSSATSSVTFSNIPTTFTDLVVVANFDGSASSYTTLTFNGVTGTSYSRTRLIGDGSATSSDRTASTAGIINLTYNTAGTTVTGIYQILNYSNSTTYKIALCKDAARPDDVAVHAGTFRGSTGSSTEPITSVTLTKVSGNYTVGSTFTLYGITAAETKFIPTKAAGGDIVVSDGTYAYHAFTTSGIFKPAQSLTADYLVIAGGAGGSAGGNGAGGGGAGGFRELSSQSLTATDYTITIGAGGVGSPGGGTRGTSGGDTSMSGSAFTTITRTGGGGGGICSATNKAGVAGGSGGGAGATSGSSAAVGAGNAGGYTPVEGFAGGLGSSDGVTYDAAGGGGGAGAVGSAATSSTNGAGGVGVTSSLINAIGAATKLGQLVSSSYYFAGGGGGGSYFKPAGAGGSGGGGIGANTSGVNYGSGLVNSGSGGGGGHIAGGNGGSGLVIVRYAL